MDDLNDIHQAFKLPKTKQPGQWRDSTKAFFENEGKIASVNLGHRGSQTLATQEALYAYAMWCAVEFYMVVVDAFTALTNGDIEEAQEIAQTVVSVHEQRATELYLQGHH